MHFKYDQHLELHNGIHSAIRGKILEATFAPVWVEPLESSVMGSGFGESGSTTAQTFAISGISGSNVKRARLVLPQGAKSMGLSVLLNQYYGLFDECNLFQTRVVRAINERMTLLFANPGLVAMEPALLHLIQTSFPAYHKLRRNQARLDAQPRPVDTDPGITAKDKEMILMVQRAKRAVDEKVYYYVNGAPRDGNADDFVSTYIAAHLLEEGVQYAQAVYNVLFEACNNVNPSVSSLPVPPGGAIHTHYMQNNKFVGDDMDMALWRAAASLTTGVLACMFIGRNARYAATVTSWSGNNPYNMRADRLMQILNAVSATPNATKEQLRRMSIGAMALSCFASVFLDVGFGGGGGPVAPFTNEETCFSQYTQSVVDLCVRGNPLATPAILGVPVADALQCFHTAVQNADALAVKKLREDRHLEIGLRHLTGVHVGSMFSQSIIYLAYHGVRRDNQAVPVYRNALDIPAAIGGAFSCSRRSRLCMLVSGESMVRAGYMVGHVIDSNDLFCNEGMGVLALALYLVHVDVMGRMMQFVVDSGWRDVETWRLATAQNRVGDMREHADGLDWTRICTTAVMAAKQYAEEIQRGGLPGNADKAAFMTARYDIGPNHYTQEKLRVPLRVHINNPPIPRDILQRQNAPVVDMMQGDGRLLTFAELHRVLADKDLSQNEVFRVVYYALYSLDRQTFAGGIAATARGPGTDTHAPIGGLDEENDGSGGIMHITSADIGGASSGPGNTQDSAEQPGEGGPSLLTLGSILLDSSKKRQMELQHEGAALPVSEEGVLDTTAEYSGPTAAQFPADDAKEAGTASSPTGSVSEGRGKKDGSTKTAGTGKGSFKRVSAKLL